MLLRNYDNLMVLSSIPCTIGTVANKVLTTDTTSFADGHLNAKDYTGSIKSLKGDTSHNAPQGFSYIVENGVNTYNSCGGSYSAFNIIVGSGSSEVTYDDYKLDTIIPTSDITYVAGGVSVSRSYDGTTNEWISTITKKYSAINDITVTEIGMMVGFNSSYFLVYRELLETPINVPADSNFIVTITIKMGGNSNKPANYVATASVE